MFCQDFFVIPNLTHPDRISSLFQHRKVGFLIFRFDAESIHSFLSTLIPSEARQRTEKLDTIIQKLYEDNVEGKITDERFAKMSATYESEQRELENRINELQDILLASEEKKLNVDSFLKLVRNSTDITELTPEIIRTFVERIEVFQSEKVPGTRTKKQTICIHWNYIGAVEIPEKYRKTA